MGYVKEAVEELRKIEENLPVDYGHLALNISNMLAQTNAYKKDTSDKEITEEKLSNIINYFKSEVSNKCQNKKDFFDNFSEPKKFNANTLVGSAIKAIEKIKK